MKTYILDDEPGALDVLEIYLNKHFSDLNLVGKNTFPLKAIPEIIALKPDLLFIDVQMPKLNGFEVLEKLPKPWPIVIFVTAFDKFAIEAIKFSALYYLLKPLNLAELKTAISKAIEVNYHNYNQQSLEELLNNLRLSQGIKQKIAIKNNDVIEYVEIVDIMRCEADNNYTKIYINGQKRMLVSKTLKEFEMLLEPHSFVRIHQSHLVNKIHIKRFIRTDGGAVVLSDGTELPVARARKDHLIHVMGF